MSNHGLLPARPAALATVAILAVGCGGSSLPYPTQSSVSATPPPSPSATPASAETWALTYEVIEASGRFCVDLPGVGQSGWTTFTLVKGERAASFNMSPMEWRHSYSVALNGLEFAGAVPTRESAEFMCVHYRDDSSLSGSFSEDGEHLTATETWTFTLDSGEVVTRTFRWTAAAAPWDY